MGTSWENGYMNDEIFRAHLGWIGLEQYDETNEVGQRFLDRFAEVHGRRPEYIMPIYGHDVGQAFVAALEAGRTAVTERRDGGAGAGQDGARRVR